MRQILALACALAYVSGRSGRPSPEPETSPTPRQAPGAASEPAIVEPWRSTGIPSEPDPVADFLLNGLARQPDASLTADDAFAQYQAWAAAKRLDSVPSRLAFMRRLAAYATFTAPTPSTPALLHGYALAESASDEARDSLAAFLYEMLIPCEGGRVTLAVLHDTYVQWCRARQETPFRFVAFAHRVKLMRKLHVSHAGWAVPGVRLVA